MVAMVRAPFDARINARGSTATLYAPDGVSGAQNIRIAVGNATFVKMIGTARADVIRGLVPSTVTAAPGQAIAVPDQPPGWYVVAKALQTSRNMVMNPGTSLTLLALPYLLTVRRPDPTDTQLQTDALDGWDEPIGLADDGQVNELMEADTIRVGFSNQFDPLSLQTEGDVPLGSTTLYTLLGSGGSIQLGDEVLATSLTDAAGNALSAGDVPLSLAYTVTATNHLFADGIAYATQALLSVSTGTGALPFPILVWDEGNWDEGLWG